MKKIFSVLFWSVISAAFIGPGTITTAASAGARFEYALLWALLFSTIATLVLQEASARITVASGLNLGQAIRRQFQGGVKGALILALVLGAIVFGCAAYEAGNILGGVAGAALGTGISPKVLTLLIGGLASLVLWMGSTRAVAYTLSVVVAFMGMVFIVTAFTLKPPIGEFFTGSFIPSFPSGSGLLILGLIGTTVVPYNLFLGSGLAKGQTLEEIRFGLTIAILLGGFISMGVLVVGAAVTGTFSYEALAATLTTRLGSWGSPFFAFGLFAAGFSSAITAPLAAAITAKSLFEKEQKNTWHEKGMAYRAVWLAVLLVGVGFGIADVKPIPAIILAQALNGVILPFAAIFLLLVVNDSDLMKTNINGKLANTVMSVVVAVAIMLGISNILRAGSAVLNFSTPDEKLILIVSLVATLLLIVPISKAIRSRRRG